MKSYYAVAAMVSKNVDAEFTAISKPIVIEAVSEEEAIGIAIKYMYKEYPIDEGWQNHSAQAVKVPAT